ncbi:hypothetical protein COW94_02885 [Candidatus Peregrinibacteria bacterium CG22_combo_CG10-13_8_21_14_all_44_10]|nr:MAG: hypothetical protein AUK45_00410 [Candidatus Peregrinibacteria bacterium CG2_30_44_17]PIP66222.1 MAG: hypothetical protein COW94_02885 [Candidatus Peregrinibacteria bacterium CG22_combo_CG10-13_8_21_14_all_44_10]PIS04484.1 MAG: hypothetical protein COT83_00295 [Candidatus Peregrinibacteria bacterium CG10_big_fil_rev_8_21_14_0_10_44_7]PIX79645.1 MAG: hypothetical protein COZ35_03125 [Candidatus Peregrinibacteria bacterium CG_4_10_14_3_um_filter_44_21]PJB88283.1 MAG: hypothetical protein 
MIADTIGFISDLPPLLFQSFITTLEEVIEADLLLHIIDAADPKIDEKIEVVENILKELGCENSGAIYVFNKIDLVTDLETLRKTYEHLNPVYISAKKKAGYEDLKNAISKHLL